MILINSLLETVKNRNGTVKKIVPVKQKTHWRNLSTNQYCINQFKLRYTVITDDPKTLSGLSRQKIIFLSYYMCIAS